ncbi:MAG TPA: tetratricopeptide repeat protein [Spirochaetota bacterium]|nr:tetratricopeptide repeat protein [Spirochaetota bacterium]HOL57115.1 tetratricopeptide repeat protein [Spirochaetota bacterium]HPP04721.1 tetratricopeptide repeat protein [Spirochaetota bacterium]
MKKIIIFLFFLVVSNIYSQSDKDIFDKAIILYNNGSYEEALTNFKVLLSKGYSNFEIYYNIGCCYFKLKKYGFSRFYFEKALIYKPFDKDLFQNLYVLYNKILKNPELGIQEIMTKRVIYFIPLWILMIFFILTFLVIVVMIIILFNFVNLRKIAMILISIFIFLNLVTAFIFFLQYAEFNKKAFVVTSTTNVYLTPNEDNIIFSVLEGTKGTFKEEFGNFVKVNLSDGTSGWIKKDFIVY